MNDHDPIPKNLEAEAALLGSLLIDPDAFSLIRDEITASRFHRQAHRRIFQAMATLDARHVPADLITLTDLLESDGHLEEAGGLSYISSLANQVPTSNNVAFYAAIVLRTAVQRDLLEASGKIAGLAVTELDPMVALTKADALIRAVDNGESSAHAIGARDALDQWWEGIDTTMATQPASGVTTGFTLLDTQIIGLMPGELMTIVGRPGVSKSALLLEMAYRMARRGKRVLYVSLEMPERQLIGRLLASKSGVDTRAFRAGFRLDNGAPDHKTYDHVMRYYDEVHATIGDHIFFRAVPTSVEKLRAITLRMVDRRECDVVMVDYLGLMDTTEHFGSNYERVSYLAKALKAIAMEARVPLVTLAQLSRKTEGRENQRPQLSDVRDSGVIEEASDILGAIYRPSYYDSDLQTLEEREYVEFILLKARDGVTNARIPLRFTPHSTTYADWPMHWDVPKF